jgi:hypothetical protein
VGLSPFVEVDDLIGLADGFLWLFFLLAFLDIGLLNALTGHAELVGLSISFEFCCQKLSNLALLCFAGDVHSSFIIIVSVLDVSSLFHEKLGHFEVPLAGSIIERRLRS